MVVAHPDDESLFGGAQLLTSTDWKVVCVTNGGNLIRRPEFISVMNHVGAEYEMWDYYDHISTPLDEHRLELDLVPVLREREWEKVVSHNLKGEYGHLHHKQINKVMTSLVHDLYVFDFDGEPLPDDVWQRKLEIISLHKSQKYICDGHISSVRTERIVKQRHQKVFL